MFLSKTAYRNFRSLHWSELRSSPPRMQSKLDWSMKAYRQKIRRRLKAEKCQGKGF